MTRTPLRRKEDRTKLRLIIQALKDKPCTDCGIKYHFACMDFDHISDNKKQNVNQLSKVSAKSIYEEVAKCELVCSNCHRIRTFKRMNNNSAARDFKMLEEDRENLERISLFQ